MVFGAGRWGVMCVGIIGCGVPDAPDAIVGGGSGSPIALIGSAPAPLDEPPFIGTEDLGPLALATDGTGFLLVTTSSASSDGFNRVIAARFRSDGTVADPVSPTLGSLGSSSGVVAGYDPSVARFGVAWSGIGTGLFAANASTLTAGASPKGIVAADFDNDGLRDLAVVSANSTGISVFLSRGDGTFKTAIATTTGSTPSGLAAGDFDGDGVVDLAVACFFASTSAGAVNIHRGLGGGQFGPPTAVVAGTNPQAVAAADLDGDGDVDLVAANAMSANVTILRNGGTGTFTATATYATGARPSAIELSDLDGDGRIDMVVAAANANQIGVRLNAGGGAFGAEATYATGSIPKGLASGDLDGDGIRDLAIANSSGSTVTWLRGSAGGAFSLGGTVPIGNTPTDVEMVDLDGDGDRDLVTANANDSKVGVATNDGAGTFFVGRAAPVGATPVSIATADFNGDGRPDVATANSNSSTASVVLGDPTGPGLPMLRMSRIEMATGVVDPTPLAYPTITAPPARLIGLPGGGFGLIITAGVSGNPTSQVYLQRISPAGVLLDATPILLVSGQLGLTLVDVVSDGTNLAVFAVTQRYDTTFHTDLVARRFTPQGTLIDPSAVTLIPDFPDATPTMVACGGGYVTMTRDSTTSALVLRKYGIDLVQAASASHPNVPATSLHCVGAQLFVLIGSGVRRLYPDLTFQDAAPIALGETPSAISAGSGTWLAVLRDGPSLVVEGRRYSAAMTRVDATRRGLFTAAAKQIGGYLAAAPGFVVAWWDEIRSGTQRLRMRRFTTAGVAIDPASVDVGGSSFCRRSASDGASVLLQRQEFNGVSVRRLSAGGDFGSSYATGQFGAGCAGIAYGAGRYVVSAGSTLSTHGSDGAPIGSNANAGIGSAVLASDGTAFVACGYTVAGTRCGGFDASLASTGLGPVLPSSSSYELAYGGGTYLLVQITNELVAQRVSSDGALLGSPIHLDTVPSSLDGLVFDGTNFVVVYTSGNGDRSAIQISPAGLASSPRVVVNARSWGPETGVASLGGGTSMILYNTYDARPTHQNYRLYRRTLDTVTNAAPVATLTQVTTAEDTPRAFLLGGSDPDGDPLTFTVVAPPAMGMLAGTAPLLTYTPPPDFAGSTTFRYTVTDGKDVSPEQTVTITVTPVNDAPRAQADTSTGPEDQAQTLNVLANDSDVDGPALQLVSVTGAGPMPTFSSGGTVTVVPAANFNGTLTYTTTISDGTATATATLTVTVAPVNDPPIAGPVSVAAVAGASAPAILLGSDVDGDTLAYTIVAQPAHGSFSGAAPALTFTANAGYVGPDTATYEVTDGTATVTGTIAISISAAPMPDAGVPDGGASDGPVTDAKPAPPDAGGNPATDDSPGGCACSTSAGAGDIAGGLLLALFVLVDVCRRRRCAALP